jgi:FxsC-like protein
MTDPDGVSPLYFFLSYARSDPLVGDPEEDPNELVVTFFADLSAAVRRHASTGAGDVGFFDQNMPAGSNWKQFITGALSAAQVFVPLYSVGYLSNSWPGRELTCFKKRVEVAGGRDPVGRLVPVLWAPLAGVKYPPELHNALDSVAEPDYADNGLCALLRLQPYHDSYQEVVDRMGAQIVEIAERDPIEPVEPDKVGDIEKAPSAFPAARPLPVFFVQVAAPTAANAPEDRDPAAYGDSSADWRPFVDQNLSLAEYARQVIERFDFDVRISEIGLTGDLAGRRPGIIVIDPSFIADEAGRTSLAAVAAKLPRWVMPLVVVDKPEDSRTRKLADGVFDVLAKARPLPTEAARRAARGVASLDAFVSIVPVLAGEAGKQYLRDRRSRVLSPTSAPRPRLGRPEGREGPPATQDSQEVRDA